MLWKGVNLEVLVASSNKNAFLPYAKFDGGGYFWEALLQGSQGSQSLLP